MGGMDSDFIFFFRQDLPLLNPLRSTSSMYLTGQAGFSG
jgi:hypothetical protein